MPHPSPTRVRRRPQRGNHGYMMAHHSEHPAWARGLKKCGLYYEGFVDDLEDTLEAHRRCTLTTYGTRTSKKPSGSTIEVDKENNSTLANKQVKHEYTNTTQQMYATN